MPGSREALIGAEEGTRILICRLPGVEPTTPRWHPRRVTVASTTPIYDRDRAMTARRAGRVALRVPLNIAVYRYIVLVIVREHYRSGPLPPTFQA